MDREYTPADTVTIPRELWIKFVRFADQHHWYDIDACHAIPGEDCAVWCTACELQREVADDVLTEVRWP